MRRFALTLLPALVLATAACGCHRGPLASPAPYQTVAVDPRRDTEAARRLNGQAVALLAQGNLPEAEKNLKQALAADTFFGPAHNNLGTVYFRQKKFYLAAWEFQYAVKLMPTKAEPQNNLGMVYETVGKLDDAAKSYEEALELEPDASAITGNLARLYVRTARNDEKTRRLLGNIVLKDARPEWVAWAREHLATMGQPQAPAPTISPVPKKPRTDP